MGKSAKVDKGGIMLAQKGEDCRLTAGPTVKGEYGRFFRLFLLALATWCLLLPALQARGAELLDRVKDEELLQTLRLRVGRSKVVKTPFAITRISVADPDIADIVLISEREVYINGLSPGVTNISLWGGKRFTSAKVTVEADISMLKEKLHQVLPKEKIAVEAAGDSIVLSGEVTGPTNQETAMNLAQGFVGGKTAKEKREKLINLMHVGGVQQVMVAVRVAEINRSVAKNMGINFTFANNRGTFGTTMLNNLVNIANLYFNPPINPTEPFISTIPGLGTQLSQALTTGGTGGVNAMFGGMGAGNSFFWTAFFNILKQQGLGRVLAEPNLVTTSGQEASFLAGGEFPIPVPSGLGTISIEYKKFGVALLFTPTVLDNDKIALRINPEVSELDFSSQTTVVVSGFIVPALRTRRASTQVEIKDGQTLAIAGLLSDQHRNVINKYPILGDLPILGAVFRSNAFQKSETELVILVTPYLVKGTTPGDLRVPTDKYLEPSDYEFYLLGLAEGRQPAKENKLPPVGAEKLPSGFGHQME